MLCSEWTILKVRHGKTYAEPLRCRCWSCEECRPRRVAQLKALASEGHPNTFLTLTVNPAFGDDPDDRARKLSRAWRLVRQRAMRKYRYKSLPFLAVFERTKADEPHLHILLRVAWLDQRWLSNQMAELMGAPIVDIRRVTSERGAARYIAKYLGKDPHSFDGCKRYWRSQDWAQPCEADHEGLYIPPDAVAIVRTNLQQYLENCRQGGWQVHQEDDGTWCIDNLDTSKLWDQLFRWRSYLAHPQNIQ